eukprot:gene16452-19776_t
MATMRTGDVISLIGASGSGKSTFLRCINFLEQPNDGAMTLDGQQIRMVSDRHGMRVADDAELQRLRTKKDAEDRARRYLDKVGLPARVAGQYPLVGEVLKVIQGLAEEGRTMIMVTHEMSFARKVSSQVLFLHKGLVEEQGAPEDVLGNPKSERLQQFLSGNLK